MLVELFYIDDCPIHETVLPLLQRIMDEADVREPVRRHRIASFEDAAQERFLGSPTIRVEGLDIDPDAAGRTEYSLVCRLYSTPSGLGGIPDEV